MASRKERAASRHRQLLEIERGLWADGASRVAGVDEAGAGPLAGPVVAGCVVLGPEATDPLLGVNDSKQLSEQKRTAFAETIRAHALAWAVAEASVEEIDRINIRQACLLAMRRALADVRRQLGALDHVLIDARALPDEPEPQSAIVKGDARSLSIAAASILAKVHRDEAMVEAAQKYPHHGFDRHKGYGTAAHKQALLEHGVTPLHRRSFAPVRALLSDPPPLPPTQTRRPREEPVQGDLFERA